MTSIALDYGSADASTSDPVSASHDDVMTDAQPASSASRFYTMPTDQAVEAGAQRGPSPTTEQDARRLDDLTLMGTEEPSEAPDPPAVEGGSDVLLETLLIEGIPITQLSTSRLFAYLTHYGAQPLGLEWIDDQRCKIVFSDERSARIGLEYLCPASESDMETESNEPLPNIDSLLEYEPDSWPSQYISSLVVPRRAHRLPGKLYNHVERQAALTAHEEVLKSEAAVSALPDDVPEIYREMEKEDRQTAISKEVRALQKLRSTLWIRHAVQDYDRKEARSSKKSQWYRQHGYQAGREIVPKLLQVGEVGADVELFPGYKPSQAQPNSNDVAEGNLLEKNGQSASLDTVEEPQRQPGQMMADVVQVKQQQRQQGDLFDRISGRQAAPSNSRWTHDAHDRRDMGRRGRGRQSRGSETINEIDHELDDIRSRQHQREASPGRQPIMDTEGRTKVKGRGRMKAPGMNVWGDDWSQPASTDRNNAPRNDRWAQDGAGTEASLISRFEQRGELQNRLGEEQKNTSNRRLADRFS